MKRFFAFAISVFIVLFSTLEQANAASSWSITSAVSAGSRSVVSATKSGYKSAVNIAPSAGRLALRLGKGANWAALVYAAIQLAPDLADIDSFKPNYPNGTVDYTGKVKGYSAGPTMNYIYTSVEEACRAAFARSGKPVLSIRTINDSHWECLGTNISASVFSGLNTGSGSINISDAAVQVIKNANAGHAASQTATRETATEMVIGGQFDQDLLAGAVPTSDSTPLVPSVPISGNGNVTHGESWEGGDSMSGATPGQQSDAAKDAADAAKRAADAAKDAAKAAQDAAREASDKAQDLVNSGADAAAQAAAQAAAAQAAKDAAASAAAAGDRAAATAAAAERAAEAATQAAQAAADKAAADVAAAKAAGDAAAQAAAEAAKAAADAAVAAAKEKQAAAEKAAEKAKAEAAKPFELPPFCSWAAPVCDFIDWVKEPPPSDEAVKPVPYGGLGDIGLDGVDRFEQRITFPKQCPQEVFSFQMFGRTFAKPIPYEQICNPLEQIAPWLLAFVMLGSAYFILENI